jgi:hypothetical protein
VLFCTEFIGPAAILTQAKTAAFGITLLSKTLPREDAHSEKLLAVASYWRKCAALSGEPWRSEMMRDTAEEFEKAAAKATHQPA